MEPPLSVQPYGDASVLVECDDEDYERSWRLAQAMAVSLKELPEAGTLDVVATYRHVFVSFDPVTTDHDTVISTVRSVAHDCAAALGGDASALAGRTFTVPVLYGGEAGPDLTAVADELDLTPEELVDRHTAEPWRVRFCASPIGTPFTDRSDWRHAIARVTDPRTAITAGTVAVSGSQSIIYPVRSPGGWRLLGRTPVTLVDLDTERLVPYRAGDLLRFRAIDQAEFDRLAAHPHVLEPDLTDGPA